MPRGLRPARPDSWLFFPVLSLNLFLVFRFVFHHLPLACTFFVFALAFVFVLNHHHLRLASPVIRNYK